MFNYVSICVSLLLVIFPLLSPALPVALSNLLDGFPRAGATEYRPKSGASAICITPAPWTQILSFILTNYIARIATFKKTSGYEGFRDYRRTAWSLLVPFLGIQEAAATIARGSRFLGKNDLDRALLAEALCVIVRDKGWRPNDREIIRGCVFIEGDHKARRRVRRERKKEKKRRDKSKSSKSRSRSRSTAAAGRSRQSRSRDSRSADIERYPMDVARGREPEHNHRLHRPHRTHHDRHHHEPHLHPGEVEYLASTENSGTDSSDDEHDYYAKSSAMLIIGENTGISVIDEPEKWKVQGHYSLPPAYKLAHLPSGAVVQPLAASSADKKDIVISNSYGVVKALIAIIQIVSSLYALFTAYADQTVAFGYSAFGFSVIPYTVMSFLNAAANVIEASYETLFLVRSDVMLEAEAREHGEFTSEVAELSPISKEEADRAFDLEMTKIEKRQKRPIGSQNRPVAIDMRFRRHHSGKGWFAYEVKTDKNGLTKEYPEKTWNVQIPLLGEKYDTLESDPAINRIMVRPIGSNYMFNLDARKKSDKFRRYVSAAITVFALFTPYITIAAISRFQRGEKTDIKRRVFMMGWLVSGQLIGVFDLIEAGTKLATKKRWWNFLEKVVAWFVTFLGTAMAIGGFVETGRMLREFGYCLKL